MLGSKTHLKSRFCAIFGKGGDLDFEFDGPAAPESAPRAGSCRVREFPSSASSAWERGASWVPVLIATRAGGAVSAPVLVATCTRRAAATAGAACVPVLAVTGFGGTCPAAVPVYLVYTSPPRSGYVCRVAVSTASCRAACCASVTQLHFPLHLLMKNPVPGEVRDERRTVSCIQGCQHFTRLAARCIRIEVWVCERARERERERERARARERETER